MQITRDSPKCISIYEIITIQRKPAINIYYELVPDCPETAEALKIKWHRINDSMQEKDNLNISPTDSMNELIKRGM